MTLWSVDVIHRTTTLPGRLVRTIGSVTTVAVRST